MSRYIDADALIEDMQERYCKPCKERKEDYNEVRCRACWVDDAIGDVDGFADNTIDAVSVVRCQDCRKSHVDGKTTHHLWCTEWGRSTDTFGYCERGEREGE